MNADDRWKGLQLPPLPEREAHERARARVRSMTPDEQRQSLIDAGIYTPDGALSPEYR